ncbi:MAG: imidazole glycerol phosphate synthase subunit HisH [Candidatus Omnitrophica bacterium]|nr:imidazole glycerol phosphate synthase subunit HisH [Candidatus Omnitrophota bacterium]
MIAVIDYGMGNIRSVQKALEVSGARTKIASYAEDLAGCEKIVLPGVGAFGDAMKELRRRGLERAIRAAIAEGRLFLGLCLGLQILFEESEEAPGVKGLSVLKGSVKKFRFSDNTLKVPHMGWNNITFKDHNSKTRLKKTILDGIKDGSYVYFVHSYYVKPADRTLTLTTTNYGVDFVSGVHKDNVYGLQFHPEKSQSVGLSILKNFIGLK